MRLRAWIDRDLPHSVHAMFRGLACGHFSPPPASRPDSESVGAAAGNPNSRGEGGPSGCTRLLRGICAAGRGSLANVAKFHQALQFGATGCRCGLIILYRRPIRGCQRGFQKVRSSDENCNCARSYRLTMIVLAANSAHLAIGGQILWIFSCFFSLA